MHQREHLSHTLYMNRKDTLSEIAQDYSLRARNARLTQGRGLGVEDTSARQRLEHLMASDAPHGFSQPGRIETVASAS